MSVHPNFQPNMSAPGKAARGNRSFIAGTGSALPSVRLTNSDLAKFLDTSDEWILDRVGIECRYICSEEEGSVSLGKQSSLRALDASGISAEEIDLIIFATVTPDRQLPSAAAMLAQSLELDQTLAFDIQAACSGFLYALATADSLLASLGLRNALVVGAETLSRVVDWTDRNTAVLFGDGAGACVLTRPESATETCILSSHLRTCASGADFIVRAGGNFPKTQAPASQHKSDHGSPFIKMSGREVFRGGVQFMTESIHAVLSESGTKVEDLKLFIPHQSNIRMIQSVCKNIGLDPQSILATNIDKIGNTSAASIPIVLDEQVRAGALEKDDLVLLTAVGSGMTFGSILLRW